MRGASENYEGNVYPYIDRVILACNKADEVSCFILEFFDL